VEPNAKPKVKRLEKPSPGLGPAIPIVRLKGGERVQFTCLSSHLWGFMIHWNRTLRRSQPHHDPDEVCEGCKDKLPTREVFYLEGISPTRGHCFFELTPEASEKYHAIFSIEQNARGLTILLSRTASDKGRMLLTWESAFDRKPKLPEEQDPEPYLQILWNWRRNTCT